MLTVIVILLFSIIALLAVPVTMAFVVKREQAIQGHLQLIWAFGLVRVRIPLAAARSSTAEDSQRETRKASRQNQTKKNRTNPLTLVKNRRFRRRILKFLSDLWHAFRKSDIRLHLRLGLGDPADTGQLWAVIGPLSAILANVKEADLKVEPEFMDAVFELDSSGTIQFIPLQIIALIISLFLSPSVWQGIKQMHTSG